MKELIKKALSELASLPYTAIKKKIEKKVSLEDYTVSEVVKKAESLGIPLDKINIETEETQTLGSYANMYLSYDIETDKTEAEMAKDIKGRFIRGAFKRVHDILIPNGYKRIGTSSGDYKKFEQYNVYDLYMAEDYDTLEAYYSLAFKKTEEGETK